MTTTHKERMLQEINSISNPDFEIPEGLYIPLGIDCLVKECPQPEFKTPAGLIIPETSRLQHTNIGIVYRVGESVSKPIKAGMKVAFLKQNNIAVAHNGVAYLVVDEYAIKAVVPPDNYFAPKVNTREDDRRELMIDKQDKVIKSMEAETDRINNS